MILESIGSNSLFIPVQWCVYRKWNLFRGYNLNSLMVTNVVTILISSLTLSLPHSLIWWLNKYMYIHVYIHHCLIPSNSLLIFVYRLNISMYICTCTYMYIALFCSVCHCVFAYSLCITVLVLHTPDGYTTCSSNEVCNKFGGKLDLFLQLDWNFDYICVWALFV